MIFSWRGGNEEVLASVRELKEPCRNGVCILDELLDYEKLEAGIAYMDRSEQDPCIFLESTIAPFKIVARQKRVNLEICSRILRGSFLVDIDENKVQKGEFDDSSIVRNETIDGTSSAEYSF